MPGMRMIRAATTTLAVVMPPSTPNGLSSVNRLPVKSPPSLIGTPRTMFANATPQSTAGTHDPAAIARSQLRRHRSLSILPRYSNATPRKISAMSMKPIGM